MLVNVNAVIQSDGQIAGLSEDIISATCTFIQQVTLTIILTPVGLLF